MANSELVNSLLRGLDLLTLISTRQEGFRLNELELLTGLKKTTLHNLLRTLAARGFVVKNSLNRYRIGSGLFDIVSTQRSADRRSRAAEGVQKLAADFPDCVISLAEINGGECRCILRASPEAPGMIQHPEQHKFMPYVSASAIVLQALDPHKTQLIENAYPFDEYGLGMWGSKERFKETLTKTADAGWYCRAGDFFIIASAMPEGYALGFKAPAAMKKSKDRFLKAAEKFRLYVWGKEI